MNEPHATRIAPGQRLTLRVVLSLGVTAFAVQSVSAQTTRTWGAGSGGAQTSGTHSWNTATNWSGDNVPNTTGSGGELATINDTLTGDRTIEIPTVSLITINWTSDPATFTDTLKLLGNVTLSGNPTAFTYANTGTISQKVLDLNTFTLSLASASTGFPNGSGGMTVRSTGGNGVLIIRNPSTGTLTIESGVTMRINSGQNASFSTVTFQDGSIYQPNSGPYAITGNPTTGFYDFDVTSTGLPRIEASLLQVRNDLTIASGGNIRWRFANRAIRVAGDFIDLQAGSADYSYHDAPSTGSFVFNGGAATQRTVTVLRTGITNTSFAVGQDSSNPGNVKLGADLSTTASFTVRTNSLLDVANYTVTAGTVVIESGSELTYTAGTDSGLIAAGNLTLNSFILNINRAPNWDYLHDLVLFTYSGTLTGTPSITFGDLPGGFTYGSLLTDNGSVRLTNVGLPEPGTAALLLAGVITMVMRRGRPV